jgi:NADH:ubiquinone oxidoreductase subunit 6 (subunit J)
LGPTTVVADIDGLFAGTNLGKIFSLAGLSALASFPFYKSYIFYIFAGSTLLVVLFIIYGYREDRKKIVKIQPIVSPVTER